jgi:hypothetical protein
MLTTPPTLGRLTRRRVSSIQTVHEQWKYFYQGLVATRHQWREGKMDGREQIDLQRPCPQIWINSTQARAKLYPELEHKNITVQ